MGTLIDTMVFIDIERRKLAGKPLVMPQAREGYVVSVVTLAELQVGVELADDPLRRKQREQFLALVQQSFMCLPITEEVARETGRVLAFAWQKRLKLGNDAWIAGTARAHGHDVLTANLKHFEPVPGVNVLPWLQEA